MKYIIKSVIILSFVLVYKVGNTQIAKTSKDIVSISEKKAIKQHKDTVKIKSAIGKSYHKYLNEIEEFKGFYSSGGHSIVNSSNEIERKNGKYSNYYLSTVEIFEETKEEGTSRVIGIKYVVMLDTKTVINYIDVSKINKPKDYVFCDEILLGNKIDRELFGYVKYDDSDTQFIKDFYKVFRADKKNGEIFEIPVTKNMKVTNANYGF